MIRTTDTGGIKLLYNGVPVDGKCTATGTGQQIGTSKFNTNYKSPAYVGYMYNTVYPITSKANIFSICRTIRCCSARGGRGIWVETIFSFDIFG